MIMIMSSLRYRFPLDHKNLIFMVMIMIIVLFHILMSIMIMFLIVMSLVGTKP